MNRTRGISYLLIVAAAILSTACLARKQYAEEIEEPVNEEAPAVAKANNEFALDIYSRLMKEPGNIFFSPYSVSTALSMTMAGARGDTEAQMAAALKLGLERDKLHPAAGRLIADLNKAGEEGEFELAVANALWGQRGYRIKRDFIDTVEKNYGGAMREVDFRGATEEARQTINKWVEDQTNDKIVNLLPQGTVSPLTRLVLTNAIYFKGDWKEAFDPKMTQDAPFSVIENGGIRRVNVPMMHQKGNFTYNDTGDAQVIELPYEGDRLSMVIVLPKKTGGLGELEATLTPEKLAGYLPGPRRQPEVLVFIPRFKIEWQATLNDTLKAMGMTDAFEPGKADFTGIIEGDDLHITSVVHKAYVDVNEEGTEAAAATGVVMGITSVGPPPTVFRANHPFLFFIRDNETGAILFMGRVADPS